MRAKTAAFLKVLNRAKPETKSNPLNIPGNRPGGGAPVSMVTGPAVNY